MLISTRLIAFFAGASLIGSTALAATPVRPGSSHVTIAASLAVESAVTNAAQPTTLPTKKPLVPAAHAGLILGGLGLITVAAIVVAASGKGNKHVSP